MRVFGQKRAMKISADYVAVKDAFTGVLFIVAMAVQDFAKRYVIAYISPAAVILKSDDLVRESVRQGFVSEDNVGDQPGRALLCVEIC